MNEIYQLVRNVEFNGFFWWIFFFLLLATHILYGLEQSNKLRPYFLGGEELPLAVD